MLLETLLTAILRARKWDPLSFFPSRTSWRCHQPVERAIIPYSKSLKFQHGARGELGPRSPAGPELGSRPLPPLLPSPRGRCGPSAAQARRLPSEKAGDGRCACIPHARRALARGRHCGQVCGPMHLPWQVSCLLARWGVRLHGQGLQLTPRAPEWSRTEVVGKRRAFALPSRVPLCPWSPSCHLVSNCRPC